MVNADFFEGLYRQGMHVAGRLRAGAGGLPLLAEQGIGQPLGHLRAAGIAGAQEQDMVFGLRISGLHKLTSC